jgi:hypothetical protein
MFLVEFGRCIPKIQKINVRRNKMTILCTGFCTIVWMNKQLAELHKQVIELGIDNIEVVADYNNKVNSIELNYVYRLEEMVAVNRAHVNLIESLEKQIKKKKKAPR